MAKTIFHDINYPDLPRASNSKARWPMWPDIQATLQAMGLAEPGHRLPVAGFAPITIVIPNFGQATLRCEAQARAESATSADRCAGTRTGRYGRPHRLKLKCTCGTWVFFGKMNQHFHSKRHADRKARGSK